MGGILILFAATVSTLLWVRPHEPATSGSPCW